MFAGVIKVPIGGAIRVLINKKTEKEASHPFRLVKNEKKSTIFLLE